MNLCIANMKELKLKQHTCQTYLKTMVINKKSFTSTGIDFFGPILVKASRETRSKQIVMEYYLLVWLSIRLELASNISTDAFIMALC